MNSKWFVGAVSEKDKKERADVVSNSRATFQLLTKVLRHEIELLGTSPVSDYDNPGWALKEADRKGQIRALNNVLALCDHQTEGSKHA